MAYAIRWLGEWSGQDPGTLLADLPGDTGELAPYRQLLAGGRRPTEPGAPLLSIFSRVVGPHGREGVPQRYWLPKVLSLATGEVPEEEAQARQTDLSALWKGFAQEAMHVLKLPVDADARFEAFTHLLHRWAWAVPCSYGEPGVSLYDEFRALSALVFASGCAATPAGEFLLVGGDIPGIQRFVYTITSKGAAKGLRGRSFFLQLLGDAVVQRLLARLGLPETNIIYAAGGNFMLLAPAGEEKTVAEIAVAINREMLAAFEGDLALCLACHPLPAGQAGSGDFAEASRILHRRLGQQKHRLFADLARENWELAFGPRGQGQPTFCAVCQHEQRKGEKGRRLEDGGWKCEQCHGFEELAQAIAQDTLLLFVSDRRPGGRGKGWQELLWQLTGHWYDFAPDLKREVAVGSRVYSVNYLDFLAEYAQGFRLIANITPREADGQVRTFEDLADGAVGLKRVGVLRMDVDDLGQVLTRWLPERTLASTAALSHALDRFFTGRLSSICREVMADPQMTGVPGQRGDLLYVIYAGGDDLFVVGAWDLIPLLAERIQRQFAAYVGHNPDLHISAGITLEDRKFPLYQAADRAGEALERGAKEWVRQVGGRQVKKNALSFLNQGVGWEEEGYLFVKELTEQLVWLTTEQGVPRSLLTTLRAICAQYEEDLRRARERGLKDDKVYYGPWLWRKVYRLSRIGQRYDKGETKQIAEAIKKLEEDLLTGEQMPRVGLATRWAEYLTRGEEAR